jgi:hypothetical protein
MGVEQRFDVCGLGDGNREWLVRVIFPFIATTEVPVDGPHKINEEAGTKFSFKVSFHLIGSRKVLEVVHVSSEIDGRMTFKDDAGKNAGVVGAGFEANLQESFTEFVIPVEGTPFKPVEGLV